MVGAGLEYCTGLLLPGERKSVEPMAARVAPAEVGAKHQSLHHFVAKAPWEETKLLASVRTFVLPVIEKRAPIRAWIVDDTGIPKKGKHSVGVARQYCGELGKQDNCQVAVALSVATDHASLPIALRLYLPETWAEAEVQARMVLEVLAERPEHGGEGRPGEQGVQRGKVLSKKSLTSRNARGRFSEHGCKAKSTRGDLGKRVLVDAFRGDPMFPRIERVVADLLAKGNVVTPVEVLIGMGLLRPTI